VLLLGKSKDQPDFSRNKNIINTFSGFKYTTTLAVNAMRENIKKRQSHDDPAFSRRGVND
jgi:hypothetical protein